MSLVVERLRGESDNRVISAAKAEDRILITNDKDFGELIFREQRSHAGVILLRLIDERPAEKITALRRLLQQHSEKIMDNFIVVTDSAVRIVKQGEK